MNRFFGILVRNLSIVMEFSFNYNGRMPYKDIQKQKEHSFKYRLENKEKIREAQRKYRILNAEKIKLKKKEYAQKNKNKLNVYGRKYYHLKKYKYYYARYHKDLEKSRQEDRKYYNEKRFELLEYLGGKCKKCAFDDPRALQIDHINGGGNQEVRAGISFNSHSLLKRVRNDPEKYQLLCANCNWIKRYENKELRLRKF